MIKIGVLTSLGIVAYLIFLVIQLPITHILTKFEPLPGHIQVYGAEGTVFAGNAALVQHDYWRFEKVTWALRPWTLVTGRLEFDVTFHNSDEMQGSTQVGVTIFRTPYLTNLHTRLPLTTLKPLWQSTLSNFGGWLGVELKYLTWTSSGPDINGQLIFENIIWEGKIPISLGDFLITLDMVAATQPDKNNTEHLKQIVHGQITDRGGPIQVQGQINIDPRGTWQITGTLAPSPKTPPKINQMLVFLGKPDQAGRFPIAFNGQLPKAWLIMLGDHKSGI